MKIAVIGAGPAGSYYASLVKDHEVLLFEEHEVVGNPVACTGILTESIHRVVGEIPQDLIISYIEKFKIVSPDKKSITVNLDKKNYILDRAKFDQWIFSKAKENSQVSIHLGERFEGYKKEGKQYNIRTNKGEYLVDMIVGADGPTSAVAKAAGIFGKREIIKGWQARCEFEKLEVGITETRLGLGEFAWIVPENEKIARVGVLGADTEELRRDYKKLLGASRILEDQSGTIPMYNPKQQLRKGKENIFLIGDAATQVKATTYGGIIYGMIAGTYLAEDKETYVKKFNAKLGKDLWISLQMRDLMNHMTEEESNELIQIFEKENNKKVLETADRNFPSKFIVQLLMKEAKLWKLGFGLLKKKVIG